MKVSCNVQTLVAREGEVHGVFMRFRFTLSDMELDKKTDQYLMRVDLCVYHLLYEL